MYQKGVSDTLIMLLSTLLIFIITFLDLSQLNADTPPRTRSNNDTVDDSVGRGNAIKDWFNEVNLRESLFVYRKRFKII